MNIHQKLAVLTPRQMRLKTVSEETFHFFKEKSSLLDASVKTTVAIDDATKALHDGVEYKERTTSVEARLAYQFGVFVEEIDIVATIDRANQTAKADLVVDGKTIAKDLPVATLMSIEARLQAARAMIINAPTLQEGIAWEADLTKGRGVYITKHPIVRKKTEKTIVPVTLAPATDKHPAQVTTVNKDLPVATITELQESGRTTSARKAELLDNIQKYEDACKTARQKANETPAPDFNIGDLIFNKGILGNT